MQRPGRVWLRLAQPRQGWEFSDYPCRHQLGGGPVAQARSSPGSCTADAGRRNSVPHSAQGPAGTANGGSSRLLSDKEVVPMRLHHLDSETRLPVFKLQLLQ